MDTFSPPRAPSINGTSFSETPRLITSSFGDGYKQTCADGLNALVTTATVVFQPLLPSEIDAIRAFLVSHVGQTFLWTIPGESAPRKWVALRWDRTWQTGRINGLTLNLEERFDLA